MKRLIPFLIAFMAPLWAFAAPTDLTFCGGATGGAYAALASTIGNDITHKIGSKLELVETGGSLETAQLMKDGDCMMGVMQADAVSSLALPRDVDVTDAHVEAVFWIHGKVPGSVKTFSDMAAAENLTKGVAYVAGSGPEITLKNFGKTNDKYGAVKLVPFKSWYDAAKAAKQGFAMKSGVRVEIGGLLYVGRPGFISDDITAEEWRDDLLIGEIGESSFTKLKDKNENQLYRECKVSSSGDTGIKTDNSVFDIKTLCMHAQVVLNNEWINGMEPKDARNVGRTVAKAISTNVLSVRQ